MGTNIYINNIAALACTYLNQTTFNLPSQCNYFPLPVPNQAWLSSINQ